MSSLPKGNISFGPSRAIKSVAEQLARLYEGGFTEIFIDLDEAFKYEQYLETNLKEILENQTAPDDQKAKILTNISTNVVRNALKLPSGWAPWRPMP
jgi:hypothetical protein